MDIITLAEVAGNLSVIGYGIGTLDPWPADNPQPEEAAK